MHEKFKTEQKLRVNPCTTCGDESGTCTHSRQAVEDPLIGSFVHEHFEILELIGTGGMGAVYKARHRIINKLVAVKILSSMRSGDAKANLRFQQEAKAASVLNHPNLVSVLDFGTLADDQPFIIMDFIDGVSLAETIHEQGALAPQRAEKIFIQIADALDHAHRRGVVHRDLKPSNIMLVAGNGGTEQVKVVDFGIAKLQGPGSDQSLTETGEVFGSPLYMSPEQCAGRSLDARTDLYSLGCLMYEALCGSPPFCGQNALQTIFAHLNEEAPAIRSIQPAVPVSLEQIVNRCMKKVPDQRYQSAAELGDALLSRQKSAIEPKPAKAPTARARSWIILCSALIILFVVVFIKTSAVQNPTPQPAAPSPAAFDSTEHSTDAQDFRQAGTASEAENTVRKQLQLLRSQNLAETKPYAEGLRTLAQVLEMEGGTAKTNEAIKCYQEALRIYSLPSIDELAEIVPTENQLGNLYSAQKDFSAAAIHHQKSYNLIKKYGVRKFGKESLLATACKYAEDLGQLNERQRKVENLFNEGIESGLQSQADHGWIAERILTFAGYYADRQNYSQACRILVDKTPIFCDAFETKAGVFKAFIDLFIDSADHLNAAERLKKTKSILKILASHKLQDSEPGRNLKAYLDRQKAEKS